jgi:predicted ATPase/DNA-binding CsgD family transcriptional regulator
MLAAGVHAVEPYRHSPLSTVLTSFVGRSRDVSEVTRLLCETRLLSLVGAAGVGKTRLAQELGHTLHGAFADGVWLVELAPVADACLVAQTVACALGVREQPGRPLLDTVIAALTRRHMLLALDNCEHVVEASALLVERLLGSCPRLRILTTSRETLRLPGETIWQVLPLSFPDPHTLLSTGHSARALLRFEAVCLFVGRTRAALPGFSLTDGNAAAVATICRRLDGIPLALELAAAQVRSLGVDQLARQMDNRFRVLVGGRRTALPRQQTLRALIDWGYELLSAAEQMLLRRLAVFSGGWTLEAAEGVCSGDGLPEHSVLTLLLQLVDKSHVVADEHQGEVRYRLLETLRQHALEKLREAREESVLQARHLGWFADLAELGEEPLWGPYLGPWFERLRVESNNLRAALEWSVLAAPCTDQASVAAEDGLRLGGALWHFWDLQGYLSEGRIRLMQLLGTGAGSLAARAKAFHAAAYLAYVGGSPTEGSRLAGEALAYPGDQLHPFLHSSASVGVAVGALATGDDTRAAALCTEALDRSRQACERRGMYYALYGLAEVERVRGDYERAVALMEEAHALTVEQGDPWSIAFAQSILGNLTLMRGELERADALQRESLALRHAIGDPVGVGRCLDALGWVAQTRHQSARAARFFGAANALRERVGASAHWPWRGEHEKYLTAARAELGEAAFTLAWAEGRGLPQDEAVAYGLQPAAEPMRASVPYTARPHAGRGDLSRRELEVATLIARGLTNRSIAASLIISEWTVDTHVRHILTKLELRSRAQVAAWAVGRGVVRA